MKHRLTVKIEKRFKRQLSKRFNPRNAQIKYCWKEINIDCPLCDEYYKPDSRRCNECPFDIYREIYDGSWGCLEWLSKIINKHFERIFVTDRDSIFWYKDNNKTAIQLLKKLREKAKKYIIWVEDTK